VIEQSRVLLVDRFGLPGMLRAARVARAADRAVVGDFESAQVKLLGSLLALVDHLIVPLQFAQSYTGRADAEEALQRLHSWPRPLTMATSGAQGALYLSGEGTGLRRQTAFRVRAVDTTGCGDVFHGAYAAALAQGLGLEVRLQMAAAAAALKATRAGGQAGIPTKPELRQFLASADVERGLTGVNVCANKSCGEYGYKIGGGSGGGIERDSRPGSSHASGRRPPGRTRAARCSSLSHGD
jgi:sugar/nucleoside kinase (ribokinase family)